MEPIELLLNRYSCATHTLPGPTSEQLDVMISAALRAPDHCRLTPWRYLFVEGEGLDALGEAFVQAALKDKPDLTLDRQQRYRNMPRRSPAILILISALQDHVKVPKIEQTLSLGAAGQAILLAASSLGLGAMWRTGDMAYNQDVHKALGLEKHEGIGGFIYLGKPIKTSKKGQSHTIENFLSCWP